jgi:hypothetical protein
MCSATPRSPSPNARATGAPTGTPTSWPTPHVGIISIIPGRNETLRINGQARLLRDAPFFDEMAVRGHRPILALLVEVDQIFFHCPKAFMRSQLWQPQSWRPEALPSPAAMVKAVQETPETLEELEDYYAPANYSRRLY